MDTTPVHSAQRGVEAIDLARVPYVFGGIRTLETALAEPGVSIIDVPVDHS